MPRRPRRVFSDLQCSASPGQTVPTAAVGKRHSRKEAQSIINEQLMPERHYSERIGWGRDAQGITEDTGPLDPSDPRLSRTYAEFPLTSFDKLIDLGLQYLSTSSKQDGSKPISLVDIGSGCGRLVFYAAMSRGSDEGPPWEVHGIEIADLLHERALGYVKGGIEAGIMSKTQSSNNYNTLSFRLGPAEDYTKILQNADIVFAYSTAFSAKSFSPALGALLLDPEWSALLSNTCTAGCIAITTDRALDPACGWDLLDRLDVENAEVFGTTGYIHLLRK